jgi:EAL and modified HD-GYP domain-containing signal transduction protein
MNLGEIGEVVKKLTPYGSSFLAEKVETYDEFQKAQELGFDSFQGYFFSKPEILRGTEISGSRLSLLQIMAEANKQDLEFSKLEKLIGRDVAISYKLLRYINSAYFKRATNISSIGQAIVLLGEKQIRQFISLVAMSGLAGDKPDELIRASIVRAKFCGLLGEAGGGKKDSSELFTLGLFSYIDAILDESMENLMKTLPLSATIKEALVYSRGELKDYLSLAQSYDRGDWSSVSAMSSLLALQEESLPALFAEAVRWADSFSDLK